MVGSDEFELAAEFRHQGRAEDERPHERQVRAEEILPGPVNRESEHAAAAAATAAKVTIVEQHPESTELEDVDDIARAEQSEIKQRGATGKREQFLDGLRRRFQQSS